MPRYFIDTDNGDTFVSDDIGIELSDATDARIAAVDRLPDMAREKMPDGDYRTFTVIVRDEDGDAIYSAALTLQGAWKPKPSR